MDEEHGFHAWLSQYIKPLDQKRRREVIEDIRMAASPGFDYFFLVVLSSAIATLGLINDSPAVIIGAMVVAPLMSPIIGVGLGSITGNAKLASNSLSALIRGAIISILLSALLALTNIYLPFVPSLVEIPHEILSRTQPTVNDLIIALAGGLAAAYSISQPHLSATLPGVAIATALMPPLSTIGIGIALGRWDIAGGAALLFLTNAITIAFAATLVFFLEGFSPRHNQQNTRVPKPLLGAALLTALLLVPLITIGARFVSQGTENRLINNVIETEIAEFSDAELVELNVNRIDQELHVEITLRSDTPLTYFQVVTLQEALVARLEKPVSLVVDFIRSETLDPLIPPTYTPTPTETSTPTPGPSPTKTITPTPTTTPSPTLTVTPTERDRSDVYGLRSAEVIWSDATSLHYLYEEPGGTALARLSPGAVLYDLEETLIYDGLVWVKVQDESNQIGWFPQHFLAYSDVSLTETTTP